MARHASTYRQARRAEWLNTSPINPDGTPMDWIDFNYATAEQAKKQGYGSKPTTRLYLSPARSKYIPHTGAKQRAKGAAK